MQCCNLGNHAANLSIAIPEPCCFPIHTLRHVVWVLSEQDPNVQPPVKFICRNKRVFFHPLSLQLLRVSVTVLRRGGEGSRGNVRLCDHRIEFILCIYVASVIFFAQKRKFKK